jgi:hypothetical protein
MLPEIIAPLFKKYSIVTRFILPRIPAPLLTNTPLIDHKILGRISLSNRLVQDLLIFGRMIENYRLQTQ